MKRLIVAADDFGLTKSINEGIAKAYREGIATFLNIIPTGEAFEDALNLAKALNLGEIGAHLSLTQTRPISDPRSVQSLIAKDGRFHKTHNEFLIKFFLKKIALDEIYIELRNQLDMLKKTGFEIINLSSHEYIHMVPDILDIFLRLAAEYDIPSIRYPRGDRQIRGFDADKIYRRLILSYFEKGMKRLMAGASIAHTDHFLGFLDSGRMKEGVLIDMLRSLGNGATELVTHPGFLGPEVLKRYRFHINCEEELAALTSPRVKKIVNKSDIKLISYREFLSSHHKW